MRRAARPTESSFGLQLAVFGLVTAAFANIYVPQPALPALGRALGIGAARASLLVSGVVLGIALANLPVGALADRRPVRGLVLTGGLVVGLAGVVAPLVPGFALLVALRFVQGLFIPTLTTAIVACLSRTLPAAKLNVVMGSYVSATVAGGLGGRLLGGFLAAYDGRVALAVSGALLLVATIVTLPALPAGPPPAPAAGENVGFGALLRRRELLRMYVVAFGAYFVFSSVFNYLPFYLAGPPFALPTRIVTLLYLSYVVGIVIGPLSGALSNRIGNGATMTVGSLVCAAALALTLVPTLPAVLVALVGVCAGFFPIHAAAAGALNRRLVAGRGRANSLYVLFYYVGGAAGITVCGAAWEAAGWRAVVGVCGGALIVPLVTGLVEWRTGGSRA
jgi:YNFM family putative membrane transporter